MKVKIVAELNTECLDRRIHLLLELKKDVPSEALTQLCELFD
jgi:hypothetical protein